MKVHVSYTMQVDDDFRYAITHQWGECGRKATRREVQSYAQNVGTSIDDDVMQEWRDCEVCNPESDRD